jgi:excisionase family DNA binding protein
MTVAPLFQQYVTMPELVRHVGSRATAYRLIGAGRLEARKLGRKTVIPVESLQAYLASLPPATIRAPRQIGRVAA